jgi:CheY-like chemotaxis protein
MAATSSVVLLIEPNDESLADCENALRGAGLDVVTVADCEAARQALATMTPRLIVAPFDVQT